MDSTMETIEIAGILLTRLGDDVTVEVWMPDETYREVIHERVDGPVSHCVYASGIRKAETKVT